MKFNVEVECEKFPCPRLWNDSRDVYFLVQGFFEQATSDKVNYDRVWRDEVQSKMR